MNISDEVNALVQNAFLYAAKNKYEYVTPETLLLMLCDDDDFIYAVEECGGDISDLAMKLTEYLKKYIGQTDANPETSAEFMTLFDLALRSALASGNEEIMLRHVLHAMWKLKQSYAVYYMRSAGLDERELLRELTAMEDEEDDEDEEDEDDIEDEDEDIDGEDDGNRGSEGYAADPDAGVRYAGEMNGAGSLGRSKAGSGKSWQMYAPCLNDTLVDVNPLIGRDAEIERTIQILCRKDKNNPLHIGEPGVGKTAITYGLVQRINDGNVPELLKGSRIYALDLAGMLAGTQYRGDFEKRFKKVLGEIEKEERPIIYLDEIHNITGAGAVGEGSFDAANMLKSYLSEGHIRFIGATTFEEYKKYFERNKSLVRRFQNVEIKEPTREETIEILNGLKEKYESFHGVRYADGVLEYAVDMSAKHINERFLPDKAIDLIDEAGAYRKLHPDADPGMAGKTVDSCETEQETLCENACTEENTQNIPIVDKDVINTVLTSICRVPVESVDADDISGLATLEDRIKSKVFGQDEAVSQVVNAIKFSKAGLLEDNKPLASLLFVGPTGVGKTEIARTLAQELGVKLVRFDMSEYGEKHAVAKLIGAPAGYVGYEEGGLLTEQVRKNPSSVVLLDEIEKAHPDIYNVLLQVMDYATLTDNQGRKADFRNVVLIMTSNAGASRLGKSSIGFAGGSINDSVLSEAVKDTFTPEFRNRLNRIVTFNPMDDDMAARIVNKKLGELGEMLKKKNVEFLADDAAKDLIRKKGVSTEFGARELDRVIRNEIKPLLVDDLLFGSLREGGKLILSVDDGKFAVKTGS